MCGFYGMVSFFVDFVLSENKHLFGTGIYAQSATFTVVGFKG
jgi:hypothetical protein